MKRIALALVLATACSAPAAGDEALGSTTSSISMPACGTPLNDVDGVYAYSNGWAEATGDSCAGQSADGTLLYQCVELAQRYFHQRFAIEPVWPVQYAAQMCTANPAGTTVHWIGNGYQPQHGDLIVWTSHTWGHVAVVKTAGASNIQIVEQNGGWSANGTRTLYASDGWGGAACFISADANTGASSDGSSGICGYGDGDYCGGNGGGTDTNALYHCTNGTPALVQHCANGCEKMPAKKNDRCKAAPTCPSKSGLYCGGNGISGDANVLYYCDEDTGLTVRESCANGCRRMPDGYNDMCN